MNFIILDSTALRGNAVQWTDRDLMVEIMGWIVDVERFVDYIIVMDCYGLLWIVMDGSAPNLSKYDSKLLPSVKYD
jgi:hypothetical protein